MAKVIGQEEKRLQVCRLPQIPVPPPGPHLEDQRGVHESQHSTVPCLKLCVLRFILVVSPRGEERDVPTATFPLRKQRFLLLNLQLNGVQANGDVIGNLIGDNSGSLVNLANTPL